MLKKYQQLMLMYLGIGIGLLASTVFLFVVAGDYVSWPGKAFVLLLSTICIAVFAHFHRPR